MVYWVHVVRIPTIPFEIDFRLCFSAVPYWSSADRKKRFLKSVKKTSLNINYSIAIGSTMYYISGIIIYCTKYILYIFWKKINKNNTINCARAAVGLCHIRLQARLAKCRTLRDGEKDRTRLGGSVQERFGKVRCSEK